MIGTYELPFWLNKDFMDGYEEGYEACKVDMLRAMSNMKATYDCSGTVSIESIQGE